MRARGGQLQPMRRMRKVHMVGIGGSGMSGIAEVLANQGFEVSGSDMCESRATRHLESLGVSVNYGHDGSLVSEVDVLVVSTAVPADNPEVLAAREARIPVVPRAEMLAELMRFRRGIAVAGTHGKTTTTSLAASLLAAGGLDPTFVIGGVVNAWGSNARLGQGDYLLAEADESDGSFLLLQPVIAIVTNIDRDHLESYEGSFDNLRRAFFEFLQHLPFHGAALLCIDDEGVAALIPEVTRAVVTFGLSDDADIRATDVRQEGRKMFFNVHFPGGEKALGVVLNLPGVHNVRNALGAIAVAWELGLDLESVVPCLENFEGIGRRFADLGFHDIGGHRIQAIEDYGHHPTEIEVTMQAARDGWQGHRLVVVFQPHRYSRTRDLFDDFSRVLSEADVVLITEVYAAGESAIDGIDSRALCQSIRARGKVDPVFIAEVDEVISGLEACLLDGDLVLLMGAGSIEQIAQHLRESNGANGLAE
jgi:UDP-N-acetylmuramate--alanine ligase